MNATAPRGPCRTETPSKSCPIRRAIPLPLASFFKRRMRNDVTFDVRSPTLTALLPHAGLDKIPSLRADNLLINRLLQAVEGCLRHTELHLIDTLLTLSALCRRTAGISLARRNRRRRLGIGLNHGCGWRRRGRLGKGREREAN